MLYLIHSCLLCFFLMCFANFIFQSYHNTHNAFCLVQCLIYMLLSVLRGATLGRFFISTNEQRFISRHLLQKTFSLGIWIYNAGAVWINKISGTPTQKIYWTQIKLTKHREQIGLFSFQCFRCNILFDKLNVSVATQILSESV